MASGAVRLDEIAARDLLDLTAGEGRGAKGTGRPAPGVKGVGPCPLQSLTAGAGCGFAFGRQSRGAAGYLGANFSGLSRRPADLAPRTLRTGVLLLVGPPSSNWANCSPSRLIDNR
jgi:hypothetical protein